LNSFLPKIRTFLKIKDNQIGCSNYWDSNRK